MLICVLECLGLSLVKFGSHMRHLQFLGFRLCDGEDDRLVRTDEIFIRANERPSAQIYSDLVIRTNEIFIRAND